MVRCLIVLGVTLVAFPAETERVPAQRLFASGVAYRDAGKQLEALREFRRAARVDPNLPFVHREIGLILLETRDFAGAAAAFRRAAQHDQSDFQSRYNLSLALANAGHTNEGAAELQSLLEQRPTWGLAWFGLGHIYSMQKQSTRAEEALRKAVKFDPGLFRAQFELGKLLEQSGDTAGAIEAYSAGVRAAPNDTSARFRLARLLRQSGRNHEAAQQLEKTRELRDQRSRGEQAAAAYTQGVAFVRKQQWTEAIEQFRRALELRPDFPETRAALAEAYEQEGLSIEKAGDAPGAIARYQLALDVAESAELANHVGVLLAKLGRTEDAAAMFRRALALKPEYTNAAINLQHALELNRK